MNHNHIQFVDFPGLVRGLEGVGGGIIKRRVLAWKEENPYDRDKTDML
eukprot:CAMPEP_0119052088 /NCGR_PEP_ID=MMETSP1177-20130426/73504_1 /TAXON_ID=2985 /ORGANISM="Ochromonas sp, Strain CCMP1899" /LENGTH=47 /DNA_ID= /DNA_START= /DNA_END= /DNA_ORIENTATION=